MRFVARGRFEAERRGRDLDGLRLGGEGALTSSSSGSSSSSIPGMVGARAIRGAIGEEGSVSGSGGGGLCFARGEGAAGGVEGPPRGISRDDRRYPKCFCSVEACGNDVAEKTS
jgi:hypothetical protein